MSAWNAGDQGSIPGSGRSPGEGNGNPLQYSCLENLMDGGAWWAAVHGVSKSQKRLSDFTFTFHFHALEKDMATHSSVQSRTRLSDFTFTFHLHALEKKWQPTPVFLPGKSQGRKSLVGYSPWGHEESDRTERLPFHFSLSCIGEGNGKPLQCSCLENPRDGGAWCAAFYGVAQSQTRLKRLCSSSSITL